MKKEFKTDDDQNHKEEHSSLDSDKSEPKKIEENGIERKEASDERYILFYFCSFIQYWIDTKLLDVYTEMKRLLIITTEHWEEGAL